MKMDNNKFAVVTNASIRDGGIIAITQTTEFQEQSHLLYQGMIDTREQAARWGLIKLGWRPPDHDIDNVMMDLGL